MQATRLIPILDYLQRKNWTNLKLMIFTFHTMFTRQTDTFENQIPGRLATFWPSPVGNQISLVFRA